MFDTLGPTLIGHGYLPIPIRPNEKRPALRGWQNARLTPEDCARWPDHGVGLLCGVGDTPLAAFDLDTLDAELAAEFENYCFEQLGPAPVRIGQWPKRLLLYRAAEAGWLKASSAWLEDMLGDRHRLEVLGAGQQFVAFGVHPSGTAYFWADEWGTLPDWAAEALDVVTLDQVQRAIEVFEKMAGQRGYESGVGAAPPNDGRTDRTTRSPGEEGEGAHRADDPLSTYQPAMGLSIDEARAVLDASGLDASVYEEWLRAGMALNHEFFDDPDLAHQAQGVWDEWSSTAPNYHGWEDIQLRWRSFGQGQRFSRNPVTMRALVAAAQSRGALDKAAVAALGKDQRGSSDAESAPLSALDYPRTEAGNAARLVDAWGRDLLYCAETGQWYRWSGVHWHAATLNEVRHLAKRIVEDMRADVDKFESDREKSDHLKWCAASQRWTMYDHMVSIAALDARLWVRLAEMDADKRFLGVQNGAVDLMTGQLYPPDRGRRITRLARVAYDPDAECPLFEQTVADIFEGDSEMPGFFQRLLGYSITGDPREHVIVLPHGRGGNGKGTTLNAVQWVLADHAATGHASSFLRADDAANGGGGSARPDLIALAGVRFVLVSEPAEGAQLREDVIKSMAGGDVLPARALYSSTIVQIQPSWTAWISTNHKPIIKGDDTGIWRRVLPLPFRRSFEGDPRKDVARPEKLKGEAAGILAWLVRGAVDYFRQGVRIPGSVEASRAEYRADMDLLGEWLSERCEGVSGGARGATLDALWLDWEPWARARGELRYVASRKNLARRLRDRGVQFERGRVGAVALGLKLRDFALNEV